VSVSAFDFLLCVSLSLFSVFILIRACLFDVEYFFAVLREGDLLQTLNACMRVYREGQKGCMEREPNDMRVEGRGGEHSQMAGTTPAGATKGRTKTDS